MSCGRCGAALEREARFCPNCGAAVAASPSPEPARAGDAPVGREVAGRYRIVEKLGEGGMGAVFRAEQIALSRTVALKVLRAELSADPGLVRRFHAEARLAARLNHPNTVTLFDFGQDDDGSLFIAMEYVEGHSLREELVASGALPPVRALRIAEQVCASLADAHAHGIVHRDLKPDNVMLTQRGSKTDIVRVLDFGIAKLRDERNDGTSIPMTQQGDLIGTPQYMAPEQIRGEQVDTYTDVYALGAMLYEMVTGRLPFEGKTVLAILSKHITEDPVPPSQRRRDLGVPPAVDALVLDCMRKEPRERPADMEALGERIARLRAQLAEADPRAALPQRRYRSRPPGVPMTPPDPRPPVARPAAAAGFEPTVWNPTPAGAAAGPAAGARGSAPAPAGARVPPPAGAADPRALAAAAPTPAAGPAPRARRRWPVAAAALIALGGGAAAATYAVMAHQSGEPPAPPSAHAGASPEAAASYEFTTHPTRELYRVDAADAAPRTVEPDEPAGTHEPSGARGRVWHHPSYPIDVSLPAGVGPLEEQGTGAYAASGTIDGHDVLVAVAVEDFGGGLPDAALEQAARAVPSGFGGRLIDVRRRRAWGRRTWGGVATAGGGTRLEFVLYPADDFLAVVAFAAPSDAFDALAPARERLFARGVRRR